MKGVSCVHQKTDVPSEPTFFAEVSFHFDYDFPMNELDEFTNIHPTYSMRFSQTQINPISREHNYGYWLLRSDSESGFDCESLIQQIKVFFENHALTLRKMICKYKPCYSMLRLYIVTCFFNLYSE